MYFLKNVCKYITYKHILVRGTKTSEKGVRGATERKRVYLFDKSQFVIPKQHTRHFEYRGLTTLRVGNNGCKSVLTGREAGTIHFFLLIYFIFFLFFFFFFFSFLFIN
ncbi:hypothetical protein M0811_14464 [Anaeramoeba ignava]|uniref:Uncharacterized protein n=1 Tax=Anaeramoeba ignava TaxID=1746090 RepID=A0A9Q0LVX1_ANAIG|nr:hypothetical protein M0811_14464 [Anaeramoeba ignava]